ncbi:MAG: ribulose-phosphate 3-epimerase, partial [Coriobacteriales bacterium]
LNPGTPLSAVEAILGDVDVVLVMSVDPGFGGQRFIPASTERIRAVCDMSNRQGHHVRIAVDGGIDVATAPLVVAAGARVLVAGSAVFGAQDPGAALSEIRAAATTSVV